MSQTAGGQQEVRMEKRWEREARMKELWNKEARMKELWEGRRGSNRRSGEEKLEKSVGSRERTSIIS